MIKNWYTYNNIIYVVFIKQSKLVKLSKTKQSVNRISLK